MPRPAPLLAPVTTATRGSALSTDRVVPTEDITSTILRAAIYARISEDPRGLEHGVSATYTDNDISALRDRISVALVKGSEARGADAAV